jgi:hypothetical protein
MTRTYIDLVKAAKRGAVRPVTGLEAGYHLGSGRWIGQTIVGDPETPPFVFERANFEFGHHFDTTHADWLGGEAYSYYLDEGYRRITQRDFFLPQPTCAYLFHFTEDPHDFERTYCILLHHTEIGIEGSIFIGQEAPNEPFRSWLVDAASFRLSPDGPVTYIYSIPRPYGTGEAIEALTARTGSAVEDVIVATMLIASPSKVAEISSKRSFRVDLYNSKRRLGQKQLDAPCIVKINRTLIIAEEARTNGQRDGGITKRPHERRAHIRLIWRGTEKEREVKVRAASINGGNPMQPYRVRL